MKLTYFAIAMTGLCGFLMGFLLRDKRTKKEQPKHIKKGKRELSVEYLPTEYKNFLNYDGSEQA